ncbi:DsbA family oxidoreductase [Planococcus lenghuensis]|uniref:DSBA-like thioredoxin domain-containing protein n=1 Tax=Planococcus lenghuensis TaxID=2213202 RepID=A0A1Q2KV55_9BACL|nr:DsbA family oxidoreductase [Planococcus lenghuensis]AQQ52090.1 hypothetical protein B0X71_02425 [Planococcus lenghuensis]
MKIDIWSDYVCPFCYINKKRLEEAIKRTGFEKSTDIEYKAFQLDPDALPASSETGIERLARKQGVSQEEAGKIAEDLNAQAKTVGLKFNFDEMTTVNTFDAHRLAKWSAIRRKRKEFDNHVFDTYFSEGRKIGVEEVLINIAKEVDLPWYEAEKVLRSDEFKEDVLDDIRQARRLGITGIPFIVLNGKYSVSGAQPAEVLEDIIRKVAKEEGLTPVLHPILEEEQQAGADRKCGM